MIDEVRAAGGTATLVWAAKDGFSIGPVPEGWDKDWPEVPAKPTHPWRASQPGQFKDHPPKPAKAPGRMR